MIHTCEWHCLQTLKCHRQCLCRIGSASTGGWRGVALGLWDWGWGRGQGPWSHSLASLPCRPHGPQQLLPVLRLELHCLQVGLPAQPLCPPLPGRLRRHQHPQRLLTQWARSLPWGPQDLDSASETSGTAPPLGDPRTMAENTQQEDWSPRKLSVYYGGDLGTVERGPAMLLLTGLAGGQLFQTGLFS